MDCKTTLLIAYFLLHLCSGQSMSASGALNPNPTIPTSTPSAKSLGVTPTAFPSSKAVSSYDIVGQKASASSSVAPASTGVPAAALTQAAAAASSQALAAVSDIANIGSEIDVFVQVIIAIGVLPIELLIVAIVVGIHRLAHRKSSRSLPTRADSTIPRRDARPFLQFKTELEDEQRRRHEVDGERLLPELGGEHEIFQMADQTDSLGLPLQGRREIHEIPEGNRISWEMPIQGRYEFEGDECAQELESPIQGRRASIRVKHAQELESPVRAKNESTVSGPAPELETPVQARGHLIKVEYGQDTAAKFQDLVTDSTHVDPGRSHFMLRQQQMLRNDDHIVPTDQLDASGT